MAGHSLSSERPTPRIPLARGEEPGVSEALERVFEESQALLVRRLELLIEQGRDLVGDSLVAASGVLVALTGWWVLIFAALSAVPDARTRAIAAVAVGLVHVVAGLFVARRALDNGEDAK